MPNNAIRLNVRPVRAFADNYIWLIDSPRTPGRLVVVDPGDAEPVIGELHRSGTMVAAILLTHHHPDHIGGVAGLLALGPVPVIAPNDERITLRTRSVADAETVDLPDLGLAFETLHVPGHTLSHVAFFGHGSLFCGDTLFSAGCGRLFEGTATQMNHSLNRLRELPSDTRVYCGHEYTAANLRFAAAVEPQNPAVDQYRAAVDALRAAGAPSLPSNIELEHRVNPFLRCELPAVRDAAQAHAGRRLDDAAGVFAVLRAWKDRFPS